MHANGPIASTDRAACPGRGVLFGRAEAEGRKPDPTHLPRVPTRLVCAAPPIRLPDGEHVGQWTWMIRATVFDESPFGPQGLTDTWRMAEDRSDATPDIIRIPSHLTFRDAGP